MEDRGFNEIELRGMMQRATAWRPSAWEGRFVVESAMTGRPWEIVVEPDAAGKRLVVVTAYRKEPS